jgi:RNA polymerase sigma-70 factor (ECF subfamily)
MQENESLMSDEEAVALALQDKAFFGHIVLRYEDKLSLYIRRLGIHNSEDREDVLQNIFIKVYKNLNAFDRGLSFSSWIYRIAHNEAISFYRMKHVRPEGHLVDSAEDILSLVATNETDAEKKFDTVINTEEISGALRKLSQKYKDPLILRFFEHKEYEEISDILKIPVGTVGTLIHRGKQELKKHLEQSHLRI